MDGSGRIPALIDSCERLADLLLASTGQWLSTAFALGRVVASVTVLIHSRQCLGASNSVASADTAAFLVLDSDAVYETGAARCRHGLRV
jgi:hypothetical protein